MEFDLEHARRTYLKTSKHCVLLCSNSGRGRIAFALFYLLTLQPTRWCSDQVQSIYCRERFCSLGRCLFGETWFCYWFLPGCLIRFATSINMQRIPCTAKISLFNWLLMMFLGVGPAKAEPPFSLTLCKPVGVTVPAPKQTAVTREWMNKQCDEEPKESKFCFL